MRTVNQYETPLFTGLVEHARRNPIQFHIPGHKRGAGMAPEFREFIGERALSIDLINIAPLDDLHNPHGIIREAQAMAAEAFGADHTYFSVQGTSGAIITMIMTVCGPGDKILVPRNVHKSVLTGIVLSGALPIFMNPDLDYDLGIAHGVSLEAVRHTLDQHPDAKGVLVINPTYYGVAADLKAIVDLAHSRGVPVLVDEAHGVHLCFHEGLPLSAMQAGADMAATSVHKLGGALTQASILNVREGFINPGRVQAILSMLTTTSTSYLLLASLDVARKHLATRGRELIDRAIRLAENARRQIDEIPGLYCLGPDAIGHSSSRFDFDPTKLCINVKDLGVSGAEVEQLLREEFNIEVELSDLYNVLCIVSLGHTQEDLDALVAALRSIAARYYKQRPANVVKVKVPVTPILAMHPRAAFYAETEVVPLREAEGRVIAESIMVYPPGIPILLPGEIVAQENLDYVEECMQAGLPVQGPEDPELKRVKVVKDAH
ncbi:MAG: aminotransferase class I/II-fold pyridoxal phosphate-dependent enzyme [Symbiobacterium sp.]|uniref:aminotransferase class I/II-fold pyridoxal phosphate-dependent enzyme n=1 Tax=Symbiobacterium sp. TaxID=1971213 RepID=UPI003464AE65